MDDRILERVSSQHPLQTLTAQELRKDALPVTRDPQPKPCKAWVRFGPHAVEVDAVVVVWNDLACGIQFTVGATQLRCWVWANAVTPMSTTTRTSGG
ncbi:hypothetical protein NQ152_15905 [Microbacterium sp. zg.B48]|uniref:hypothetical protein n=1 Tax=unclassified Microbacterium TaxID=2609290 RepID=UPI00214C1498|nr:MULTISPECIES: hypothetical protein [unclassified Microbacterium]MCR2764990.1 hypothetical protein [Microbacterium sp. zg.B48]MCR2811296.1 hypothetical protein [Microbacterium sp. zg.B185]WIM19453.1 hypothetical protein QNO12_01190 [Microbacterium sp. zg-B185]